MPAKVFFAAAALLFWLPSCAAAQPAAEHADAPQRPRSAARRPRAAPAEVVFSTIPISIAYPVEGHTMAMDKGEVIFGAVSHPKRPLRINGKPIAVHRLGGFIDFLPVTPGTATFVCELDLPSGTTTLTRTINVIPPLAVSPPAPVRIDLEARQPAVDVELRPGEFLNVQMKGSTGGKADFSIGGKRRYPMTEFNAALGIYQGVYQVKLEDLFDQAEIEFALKGADGTATAKAKGRLTVRDTPLVAVVRSSGSVAVKTGPGNGYLLFPPVGTRLLTAGRFGDETKVYLSPSLSGWIDSRAISALPAGTLPPRAVLGSIKLTSAPDGTTVSLAVSDTIPFIIDESPDLASLTIRLYNTTGYTNWIVYDSSDTFVRQVQWRQEDANTAAVTFQLDGAQQLWGYHTQWEGGSLRLELRRAPRFAPKGESAFKGLNIVVDAGHMPSAHGAVGPRGLLEMDANLAIAKALAAHLGAEGANVVMTRDGDEEVGLAERPKIAWERRGDLFLSVHNNAIPDGEDPFSRPRGYSVFYYHPHSFALAKAAHASYRRRIPLADEGLRYGNLLVARMTQMPAILTESAYIIFPDQEALLQSPSFQRRLGKTILEGARAFLESARRRQARLPEAAELASPAPEPDPSAAEEAVISMGTESSAQRYLKTLIEILAFGQGLREGADDKVWIRVLEKLAVALDAEAGTYFVVGVKGRELVAFYSLGATPDKLSQVPIPMGKGLCGWVAVHREPLLVEDAYKDGRFLQDVDALTGFKTRSVLCVPLMDRLDLVGVLELLNKRDRPFGEDDMRLVAAVCEQVSLDLRLVRLEAMLNKVTAHNASILENLSGGFLALDLRGRVIICNPAAKRILELQEEVMNVPVDQALRHLPALADILTKTMQTKQVAKRQDLRWSHKDQPRLLGYSTLLIQDPQGNFTGVGVTFQDLTAIKR